MEKNEKLFVTILIVVFVISLIWFFSREKPGVCFNSECFKVEIADSIQERTQGLMFREELGEREGMLFIFEEPGIYGFWMKNTLIPLDIIWITEDGEVVEIVTAKPCKNENCESYVPSQRALYVLEINGGKAEEIGLGVGDFLDFKY